MVKLRATSLPVYKVTRMIILLVSVLFCSYVISVAQGRSGERRSGKEVRHTEGSRNIGNTRDPGSQSPAPKKPTQERGENQHPPAPLVEPEVSGNCGGGSIVIDRGPSRSDPQAGFISQFVVVGRDVTLADFHEMPAYSGFDFSDALKRRFDDSLTDVFLENDHGDFYFRVREDSDIMDIGASGVPYDAIMVPPRAWSEVHDALVFQGHEYIIRTWDQNYAKIRVTRLTSNRVVFDWAYQFVPSGVVGARGGYKSRES